MANTMRLRLLISGTIILFLACYALSHTATTEEEAGDVDARIVASQKTPTGFTDGPKKKGFVLFRAFKFPFKQIGRMMGGNSDNHLQRLTEKDAAKFASVGVEKISDGRTKEEDVANNNLSPQEHLERGREFLNHNQLNDAIAELSTAVSLSPRFKEAHNLLGVAYDRKGFGEQAKKSYERALKCDQEDAQILNNLGYSLYLNGNYRAAVDRLKRAARLAPQDPRIQNNLALSLSRLGRWSEAYQSFLRAGGEVTGRVNLASMLSRAGRNEEAIKYYEEALRLDPASEYVRVRLNDLTRRVSPAQTVENGLAKLDSQGARE